MNARMKKSIGVSPNIETLFGTRDENVRLLEDGLNITINLRSNAIELEGAAKDVARAEQVFTDYETLQRSGHTFNNGDLNSMLRVLTSDPNSTLARIGRRRAPAFVRTPHRAAQEQQPAPLPRSHREARHGVWHRPGWNGQDLSRRGHGDFRAAGEARESHYPGASGRGSG